MGSIAFSLQQFPDGKRYTITVTGPIIPGETYTVTSNVGVISQYTAITGDDVAAVINGLVASSTSVIVDNVTFTSYRVFLFSYTIVSAVVSTPPPPPTPPPTVLTTPAGITITYGLKYQCTFDPPSGPSLGFKPRYRLEILQKNYTGAPTNVTGGRSPVVHSWQTDDTKAPIRGSSLAINLINSGNIPLRSFYSASDDEFKVRFYWLETTILARTFDNLLYEGFLVQDDCREPLLDYEHDISLSSNDGLGLLKDVKLDEAPASFEIFKAYANEPVDIAHDVIGVGTIGADIQVGDKIQITGTRAGEYTVLNITQGGGRYFLKVTPPPGDMVMASIDVIIKRNSLLEKFTLLSIIKRCLSATGLQLQTDIYCNLLEVNQLDTSSFLDKTLIDVQTFLVNDSEYKYCYTVLEELLGRFNLSLFQAEGRWNIVRWDELRYYSNLIPGFRYDKDMNLMGAITLPAQYISEPNLPPAPLPVMYPTFQLTNNIFRGFKYDKETFNYKQPPQLLRNFNLQQLGAVINSITSGTGSNLQTTTDYEMPWWTPGFTWSSGGGAILTSAIKPFIRVIVDSVGNELGRYAVIKGNPVSDNPSAAASFKIEVNAGDSFKLSYSFRTINSQPGPTNIPIDINLVTQLPLAPKGVNNRYLDEDGTWDNTRQFVYSIATGENANEWKSLEVTSDQIPFDGLLYVKLAQASFSHQETHYRDIRFEYIPTINQSTKIKGHTHTSSQITETKNKEDIEITMDTSPRNSVVGTLFLSSLNGILQKLTTKWKRGHLPTESRNLGDITTTETLFWRRLSRTALEGSFIGLLHNNKHRHISLLSVMRYNHGPTADLTFGWGKLELDYENDMVNNSTMWEMCKDGEVDADLFSEYLYKYLYETK